MKFVIEALGLTSGGGKAGLLRLLPALAQQGVEHKFVTVLADREEFRALERPNLKLVLRRKPVSLLRRHLHLQRTMRQICAAEGADALLCLGNFGPWRPALPTVVLLHNAQYVSGEITTGLPATPRERLVRWYGRRYFRRLPDNARVVVQTELMKRRLVEALGVPTNRVAVIPDTAALPVEADTAAVSPGLPAKGVRELTSAQNACAPRLGEIPFTFLCMAHYYPHKNLEVLPEAMKRLRRHSRRRTRCILTIDPAGHAGARKLLQRIESESLEDTLVNIGPLEGHGVVKAYRSPDALILPTLLESFGRSYLEAMCFDLPVLTSDRDFAREVCRGAALYFDPLDPDSVAKSMARIMEDGDLRDRLAAERRRIPIPSWDEVAAQFLQLLERAARDREEYGTYRPARNAGPHAPWLPIRSNGAQASSLQLAKP